MNLLEKLAYFAVCTCCAVPAAVLGVYFGFFIFNPEIGLPFTIDNNHHEDWHGQPTLLKVSPLFTNTLLLFIFPIQHSFLLRGPLNKVIKVVIPDKYFRPFYALTAGLSLGCTMYFWQAIPTVVWSLSSPLTAAIVKTLGLVSFFGVIASVLTLDTLALSIIGLKEPLMRLLGWKDPPPKIIDSGLYSLMRHPAYTLLILALWITPKMTVGHLLLASIYTLYMVLAVKYYEEPALLREFGSDYAEYMKRTPCFIPISFTNRQKIKKN